MAKIANPRFPHWCRIYERVSEDAWSDGEERLLYEGECRLYVNDRVRSFYKDTQAGRVTDRDYGLNMPNVDSVIKSGYYLDVKSPSVELFGVCILESVVGNLGTTLYFNRPKN